MFISSFKSIFITLIMVSPTLTVVDRNLWVFLLLLMSVIAVFLFNPFSKSNLILATVLTFFVFVGDLSQLPFKFISFVIVAYLGVKVGSQEINIKNALLAMLWVHLAISLIQLLGVSEFVYSWATYANSAATIHDSTVAFLPQFRPSGIFPAPTFVSYFLIIVFAVVLSSPTYRHCKTPFLFCAVVSGSTMGLLLIALFVIITSTFRARLGYLTLLALTFLSYRYFFADFFAYNFSTNDMITSILERPLTESILTRHPFRLGLIFVLFAFSAIIFVVHRNAIRKINVKFFRNSFLGLVCVFLPIILHDSNGTVIGQFMIGVGIGLLKGPVSRRQLLNFVHLPKNSKQTIH